ncbi:hypothetical protein E9993_01720 [Labilibacter sediminis]|nr:hypothetical protein E9993_01720 [Labilibacter sediminis]
MGNIIALIEDAFEKIKYRKTFYNLPSKIVVKKDNNDDIDVLRKKYNERHPDIILDPSEALINQDKYKIIEFPIIEGSEENELLNELGIVPKEGKKTIDINYLKMLLQLTVEVSKKVNYTSKNKLYNEVGYKIEKINTKE